MAWTTHGHHIPGTPMNIEDRPRLVARCGGPGLCKTCSLQGHRARTDISTPTKGSNMEFTNFVRKPFEVEAVEVTKENITEIAKFVGTLREKEDGTPYIQVDRRMVPNIFRVYPGFWMTRMGDNIRCYSKKIFNEQFVQTTPEIDSFVAIMNAGSVDS